MVQNSQANDAEISNNCGPSSDTSMYQSREEYLEKLKKWLDEARLWHGICAGFPYYMNLQHQSGNITSPNYWNALYQSRLNVNNIATNQNNISDIPFLPPGTYEFVIPPLWKRMIAELLDFFILLIIKMVLTFLVIETFYVVSIENYHFDSFRKNLQDPKLAVQMSMEILTLELLHRFIVCCYEVYWLKGGTCATPGKRYMGLVVVHVDNINSVPGHSDEIVRVHYYGPLGLQKAIIRAVLKNIFLGVMLPVCFTLYIFRYNRTGYDAFSGSLVVECTPANVQHVQ